MATADDVRRLALALPKAIEQPHRKDPAFWVDKRIFAMLDRRGPFTEVKLDREDQLNLIAAHPGAIEGAPNYPHHGWTYVWFEKCDETLLALVLRLAWSHVAPKRWVKAHASAMP